MPTTQGRPEQFRNLFERKPEGLLYMLNLYKFKEKAEYADERETNLSGAEAYGLFAAGVVKLMAASGGSVEFAGTTDALLIGDGELEWDSVAILKHASFEAFIELTQSAAYAELSQCRDAGLAHQILINCLVAPQSSAAFGISK